MTTTRLDTYRISCDWQYAEAKCHGALIVRAVPDKYDAEEHARKEGWRIDLSASCPACEELYQSTKAGAHA